MEIERKISDIEAYEQLLAEQQRRTYNEWRISAGIPRRFWSLLCGQNLKQTESIAAVREFMDNECPLRFLVLAGGVGVGKTVAAAWAIEHFARGLFLDATKLARSSWFDRETLAQWEEIGTLALDDLGAEYCDQHGAFVMLLDSLMNARYNNDVCTILTTNLTLERFQQRYSERMMDRIHECGRFIELKGPNLRREQLGCV